MNYGLLGQKLSHSYSPRIHNLLGNYPYTLYEIKPNCLADFLDNETITGLNVTIPYKKTVIPYCVQLSETAQKIGAVNTMVRNSSGAWIGHNTDYFGLSYMLQKCNLQVRGKKVLILGSGGASNTAVAVLNDLGADTVVISRTGKNHYGNLHLHSDASVIVNATPVGMYPNNGNSPIDLSCFKQLGGVLDMVYNPARTKLLLDAEAKGIVAQNGLWMLIAQAKESAQWFLNREIDNQIIDEIYRKLCRTTENIILIGMPGCGKSTIGKMLAEELDRQFVDADEQLEHISQCSIPEIFRSRGENYFRKLETEVLSQIGKQSACVISTGGGCVTRECNYPLLHQNGKIIWIQRDIDRLPTDGRPVSQQTALQDLYRARMPLYAKFADCIVENNGRIQDTLEQIRRFL